LQNSVNLGRNFFYAGVLHSYRRHAQGYDRVSSRASILKFHSIYID
jgi:hypothetical protein